MIKLIVHVRVKTYTYITIIQKYISQLHYSYHIHTYHIHVYTVQRLQRIDVISSIDIIYTIYTYGICLHRLGTTLIMYVIIMTRPFLPIYTCIYYTHIYLYIHTYPHTCYMYVNTYTSLTRFCAPRLIIMTQPLYALDKYKLVHTYPHTRLYL